MARIHQSIIYFEKVFLVLFLLKKKNVFIRKIRKHKTYHPHYNPYKNAEQAKSEAYVSNTILKSEVFTAFFSEVLDRWDEIRSTKGYVAAAFKNMLNR